MRYLINPVKALLSLFAFILFLFLFVVSFQSHKMIPMVLYAVLSVVYFLLLCHFTKYLEIDESGVRNRFLWKSYNELSWDKIQEVGIANMKVMKNAERTKVGELYLYFSPESMTEKRTFSYVPQLAAKRKTLHAVFRKTSESCAEILGRETGFRMAERRCLSGSLF